VVIASVIAGICAFWFFGDFFVGLYLKGEAEGIDPVLALNKSRDYLRIMLIGFLPFALSIGSVVFGLSMLFSDGKFPIVKFLGGIALLWYGISDLISGWKIAKAIDEYEIKRTKEAPQQPSSDEFTATDLESAKEVEFRKED
jgi:hypothetical protein